MSELDYWDFYDRDEWRKWDAQHVHDYWSMQSEFGRVAVCACGEPEPGLVTTVMN